MGEIFTIGYEGAQLDDFLETLLAAGIDRVVDVREIPGSRRRGFSKNQLAEALENVGIGYSHFRGLGDPKPGRDAARSGDLDKFRVIFLEHLASETAQRALEEAIEIARHTSVCLLCYERDPKLCHRAIVADRVSAVLESSIRHLGVRSGIARSPNAKTQIENAYTC